MMRRRLQCRSWPCGWRRRSTTPTAAANDDRAPLARAGSRSSPGRRWSSPSARGGDDDDDPTAGVRRPGCGRGPRGDLRTLATASIDGDDVAAVGAPTLAFGDDGATLAGSTGCNQFSGTYTQSGSDLTITIGPVTRAACVDPGAAAQETAILAHLPAVASYSADGPLVLKDAEDETLLTYEPGLLDGRRNSWTATGVNNGREAVESTAMTESITADFGADGSLSGFSGCNTYNATYALSGDDGISITAIAGTQKACEDEAMTLEGQYLAALEQAATWDPVGRHADTARLVRQHTGDLRAGAVSGRAGPSG